MRILLVSNYQPPHMGGIEFAAQSLKRCWEKDGHQVTWLTTDLPRGGRPQAPDNVRVPALNFLEDRWQINSPLVLPWAIPQVRKLAREHDVVNVHSLAPGLSTVALHAAVSARRPTIVTQHVGIIPLGRAFLSTFQEKFVCYGARWAVNHGAYLTFVGEAVRTWFLEHAGLPAGNVFMTPAGIDHDTYRFVDDAERATARKKWNIDPAAFNVLFVGRFYDKKGLPLIRDLAARCPAIRFTLVGNGPVQATGWNLPNVRVISQFVSNEELRELYGAHDLFIMPSFGEGWPAVVPQAMACGLACMVSEECFEGYRRDADRFLVRPRTVEAMGTALEDAARGDAPLVRDRKALSEYSMQAWDWQRTARIYVDLFRKLGAVGPHKTRGV
jgi:glycosyltransferase involved in cell wall biosynthesis